MNILAIETSGQAGSVALWDGARLVAQRDLDPARRNAQTLAPAMQSLLQSGGWQPRAVDVVAVVIGPGSFTGLRVGVTTAKAFAYAVQARVVGVNTLDVIAAQAFPVVPLAAGRLGVGIDAGRGEVFAAEYARDEHGAWHSVVSAAIVTRDVWLHAATPLRAVSGPALDKLPQPLDSSALVMPREYWLPQASTVGKLAAQRVKLEQYDDVWSLTPYYLRKSAAEEKAAAQLVATVVPNPAP